MKTKILIIILISLAMVPSGASATVPEAIANLFDGPYHSNKYATETVITGQPLKPYSLSVFHSLAVKKDQSLVPPLEKAVKADGSHAIWQETVSKGGLLETGVYELKPQNKSRRYILYLNSFISGGNEATIIYIEGKATPEQIKKLIKTISE